jgi:hypothetical protein
MLANITDILLDKLKMSLTLYLLVSQIPVTSCIVLLDHIFKQKSNNKNFSSIQELNVG